MLSSLRLSGPWRLRGFDGQHGQPEQFCGEQAEERGSIEARVPGEVHLDLERAGLLGDCNVGLNVQAARWVEEQVWVYRTRFEAPAEAAGQRSWLVFEGLDLAAVVYLNGQEVGRHENAFTPCRVEVTGKLRAGVNTLAVRLESGLYTVSDKPGAGYNPALDHRLHKRSWLRKPQYTFSWDWSPRLVNVGIWRPVHLEWCDTARLAAVTTWPELAADHRRATLHVRAFVENVREASLAAVLRVRCRETGAVVEERIDLPPGDSRHEAAVEVSEPRLWWPRPHGEQPLYTLDVELQAGGQVADRASRRTGIRSIAIDQRPHPDGGEHFILEVNGRPIFAKGGNWVPPDIIGARPDAGRYRRLVELAADANCNTLRIWGGGYYADHALLEACDELGLLVWHDFIFACSKYPADDPEFLHNVQAEVRHVARDLSHHPSLVVWCGNNELEWGTWEWGFDQGKAHPDYVLYHHEIPRILVQEDPARPYWPSSPYSTGHRPPTDPTTGDQHPWHVTLGVNGPDFWKYREDVSRFPNEGGVLGASSPATLRQFLPAKERQLFSAGWELHDNACNYWSEGGICYRLVEFWLGKQAAEMSFDDYCFYSALLQAEGLGEYVNNFRRRMFSTSSAIFWMYNDAWPASHGWTIVDYYERRKLAYHPVRRAFAPVQVIPAIESDELVVFGVNERPEPWQGEVRWGLCGLAGGYPVDERAAVTLPPNQATVLGRLPVARWQEKGVKETIAFALLEQAGRVAAQNRLFLARHHELAFEKPQIDVKRRGKRAVFTSPVFAWGVCLDVDGEKPVADDCFDLLPGVPYEVAWPAGEALPVVQRCGSPVR